jgi:glycosyltransferase involved in cell wall biosynthesis
MLNGKRIGILIVAYNALSHLVPVLDRIPSATWDEIDEVAVFDDASQDATYELAYGYKMLRGLDKLKVYQNSQNLGYGGNQKRGFGYFAEKGFDVVVLLHGDGQYAPEVLSDLYRPVVAGRADVVLGSRMMREYGGALHGGMPLYKYVCNRILSYWENKTLGMALTEFHSGYRAYSIPALQQILLETCTDDFHFDTEIIVKLHHLHFRFLETPIPTYYGEEICHVDGLRYALDVYQTVRGYKNTVAGHRVHKTYEEFATTYPVKPCRYSSHSIVSRIIGGADSRILDLGCSDGQAASLLAGTHDIVGVDCIPPSRGVTRFSDFIIHDLEQGLPTSRLQGRSFDWILLLDILEHLVRSDRVLREVHQFTNPETQIIISVPNVANLYVRLSLLFGRFEYADRGILDRTHVRFFTKSSLRRLVQKYGYDIDEVHYSMIPFREALGGAIPNVLLKPLNYVLNALTQLFSGLLAYQIILVLSSNRCPD